MKRLFLTTVATAALAFGAVSADAAEEVTYLFPAPDFLPAFAPFQLAKAKGYFDEAGLDVTFRVGKGGADVATQVAAGNADLGGGIGDTPIIVRANGLDVRGVGLLGGRGLTQLAWRKVSGITGPEDFEGKNIGVLSFQDTTYYNLLGVLASAGLDKGDANIQGVGPGGIIQLMIAGQLDAMSGVPEWIAAVQGAGVEVEQVPVNSVFPAMAQAIIASDTTIAERPEVVKGFVNAVLKGVRDIEADPAQAAKDFVAAVPQHAGARTRVQSEGRMRDILGPYTAVAEALTERIAAGHHPWVRDVTISNSTFGNRYVRIADPRHGVHALGGGIGQGVAMGVGAAFGSEGPKAITLLGDGGTMLGLAEMITAVDENAPLVYVLMNDQAYGVIQNIQDAQYDSRRHYSKVAVPDFATFCQAISMPHTVVRSVDDFPAALDAALAADGPRVVEVDMVAIGPFAVSFSGPPAGAAGNKV